MMPSSMRHIEVAADTGGCFLERSGRPRDFCPRKGTPESPVRDRPQGLGVADPAAEAPLLFQFDNVDDMPRTKMSGVPGE